MTNSFVLLLSSCLVCLMLITPSLCSTNHHHITLPLSRTTKHHNHHHHRAIPNDGVSLFATNPPEAYTLSLSLGSPPQSIPVVFDTGSNNIWVPCTNNYNCSDCFVKPSKIVTFKPDRSSSGHPTTCSDQKCHWLDVPQFNGSCLDCNNPASLSNCSTPCSYVSTYGSGTTAGQAYTDKLHIPGHQTSFDDLFFGCSTNTVEQAEGIVGFGRLPSSLPSQLKLNKFSYCLVSHNFDNDKNVSSKLMLGDSGEVIPGLRYTPLLKNPPILPFNTYYYVHVTKVTVGGKHIKLPYGLLVPDAKSGNGGTIVDSGTTLTIMVPAVFEPIVDEFQAQLTHDQLNRYIPVAGLSCFDVSGKRDISLPEVVFHFKGGAKMGLPVDNYVNLGEDVVCLPFGNQTNSVVSGGAGPAIILGNYHQQNYYLEFDLKKERLGMKKHNCGK